MRHPLSRRRFLHESAVVTATSLWAWTGFNRLLPDDTRTFLQAVVQGDRPLVRRLLEASPSLADAKDEEGRTAFQLAHWHDHRDIASDLRAAGHELDFIDATLEEAWDVCAAMVEESFDATATTSPCGGNALFMMARLGRPETWRVHGLGCDPNVIPAGGRSAPFGALDCPDETAAFLGATDLLGNGGKVGGPEGGETLLHIAVRRGSVRLTSLLLRKGADDSVKNRDGETALELAHRLGQADVVAVLNTPPALDHRGSRFLDADGVEIDWPDLSDLPRRRRHAMAVASHGRVPVVETFLKEDERFAFACSFQDELAVEACAHVGHRPLVQRLVGLGAPVSLPTAVTLGELDAVERLLDDDPELIHERGAHDFALMWYPAIAGGRVDLAAALVERGADVDQHSVGTTALHWTARRGQRDLAAYLLAEGADVHAVGFKWDRAGQTPRALAEAAGHRGLVKLFRDHGA